MEKILIIKLSALGDIIQAEGAIHDIRLAHPDSEITVMTTPAYVDLMERCPWVDKVIVDPRAPRIRLDKMYSLRKMLRNLDADMVYDLQQVGRTDFYYRFFFSDTAWLGGARGCSHYCRRPDDRCAADHFKISFEKAGIPCHHTLQSDVSWMADDMSALLTRYDLGTEFIVLIPGCSKKHPEKRWPFYQELAALLLDRGQRVVTVPGPDEMELCREIPGDMLLLENGHYLDYFQLAGVIRACSYVVGNDTGPTHIAAHLGRPGLALFCGDLAPEFTGIQHSRFSWLSSTDLADVSVDQVLNQLTDIIGA